MSIEPLTPAVFHILLALTRGERHGYGIMQDVEEQTNSQFRMGPGTLYGTLKRMLEAGLVAEAGERSDPERQEERRRYYRLTALGREAAVTEAERLEALLATARNRKLLKHSTPRTA